MRPSIGPRGASTADAAVGDISGESLLASVLECIDDEIDRVLLLAHIALDTPLTKLEHDLKTDRRELAARRGRALSTL